MTITASDQLPLITVSTDRPKWTTTLVIPTRHDDISDQLAGLQLAHEICAKTIGAVRADWLGRRVKAPRVHGAAILAAMPEIKRGRQGMCWTVIIEDADDEDACASGAALYNAAISAARDAAGFTTHRVERK